MKHPYQFPNRHRVAQTAYPDGTVIKHQDGMEPVRVQCQGAIMKAALMNEIRDGGICYSELSLLEQAKKLIER